MVPNALAAWKETAHWANSHAQANTCENTAFHTCLFISCPSLPSTSQSASLETSLSATPPAPCIHLNAGEPMDLDCMLYHPPSHKLPIYYHCNQPRHIQCNYPSSITDQMWTMWTSLDKEGHCLACQALRLMEPELNHEKTIDQPQEGF